MIDVANKIGKLEGFNFADAAERADGAMVGNMESELVIHDNIDSLNTLAKDLEHTNMHLIVD